MSRRDIVRMSGRHHFWNSASTFVEPRNWVFSRLKSGEMKVWGSQRSQKWQGLFRKLTIRDSSDIVAHKLENASVNWVELWPFTFEKGYVNVGKLSFELNMLTARVEISDEVDVEVSELVREVIFDAIGDRAEEQGQFRFVEHYESSASGMSEQRTTDRFMKNPYRLTLDRFRGWIPWNSMQRASG